MSGDFYRAFEDRYRGSRQTIKERLRAYLPFANLLVTGDKPASALDLGCGRGEWLELLSEHGFTPRGVDLDDGMLAACRERGLSVETAEAICSLRALPDDSVAVVSAFHLVEHLSFDAVQELVVQSLRVLQPGGLLIMETPNPENPMVGACRFYLDPSHQRPLPPLLLSFLTEHAGFARQKVVRLQEDPLLHTEAAIHLINVLDGASPDYGVVAQKAAPADVLQRFNPAFERDFGIGIGELAQRFEDGQRAAVRTVATVQQQYADETNARLAEAFPKTDAALADIRASIAQADAKSAQLSDNMSKAELRLAQYDARLAEASARTAEIHAQLAINHSQHELRHTTLLGELAELRTRVAGAEAVQARNEQELTELHARVAETNAVRARQELELGELRARLVDANTGRERKEQELVIIKEQLDAVLRSTSWRISAPLRWLASPFRSRN